MRQALSVSALAFFLLSAFAGSGLAAPPDARPVELPPGCRLVDGEIDCAHSPTGNGAGGAPRHPPAAPNGHPPPQPEPPPPTAGPPLPPPVAAPVPAPVRASRAFMGPHDIPPRDFAAYGIVAFPARATASSRERHAMICEAYLASLPAVSDLGVPAAEQMVTVWPVDSEDLAAALEQGTDAAETCAQATRRYHLPTGLAALRAAQAAGVEAPGAGPYLLAWAPPAQKGRPDALVLRVDLSDVTTAAQAEAILRAWRADIERRPELWEDGWSLERLRLTVRLWADKYGPRLMQLFGA